MQKWLYIGFENVSEAMRVEKIFVQNGIKGILIPTPRQIDISCGMCWRTDPQYRRDIMALAAAESLSLGRFIELEK